MIHVQAPPAHVAYQPQTSVQSLYSLQQDYLTARSEISQGIDRHAWCRSVATQYNQEVREQPDLLQMTDGFLADHLNLKACK